MNGQCQVQRKIVLVGRTQSPLEWLEESHVTSEVKFGASTNIFSRPEKKKNVEATIQYNLFDVRGSTYHQTFFEIPEHAQVIICYFSLNDLSDGSFFRNFMWCLSQDLPFAVVHLNPETTPKGKERIKQYWTKFRSNTEISFEKMKQNDNGNFFFTNDEVPVILRSTFQPAKDEGKLREEGHLAVLEAPVKLKSEIIKVNNEDDVKISDMNSHLNHLKLQGNILELVMSSPELEQDELIVDPQWLAATLEKLIYALGGSSHAQSLCSEADVSKMLKMHRSIFAYEKSGSLVNKTLSFILRTKSDVSELLINPVLSCFQRHNLILLTKAPNVDQEEEETEQQIYFPTMVLKATNMFLDENPGDYIKLSYVLSPILQSNVIEQLPGALVNHPKNQVEVLELFQDAFLFSRGYITFLITWSFEEGLISFTIDESNSKELWYIFALITTALTRVSRSAFPAKESLQVTQIFKESTKSNEKIDLRELFMEKWSVSPTKVKRKVLLVGNTQGRLEWSHAPGETSEVKFSVTGNIIARLNTEKNDDKEKNSEFEIQYNLFDLRGRTYHQTFFEIPQNAQVIICYFCQSDLSDGSFLRQLMWCISQDLPFGLVHLDRYFTADEKEKLAQYWSEIRGKTGISFENLIENHKGNFFFTNDEISFILDSTFETTQSEEVFSDWNPLAAMKAPVALKSEIMKFNNGKHDVKISDMNSHLNHLKRDGSIFGLEMLSPEFKQDELIVDPQWLASTLETLIYDLGGSSHAQSLCSEAELSKMLKMHRSIFAYEKSGSLLIDTLWFILRTKADVSEPLIIPVLSCFERHNLILLAKVPNVDQEEEENEQQIYFPTMVLKATSMFSDENPGDYIKLSYGLSPIIQSNVIEQLPGALVNDPINQVEVLELFQDAFLFSRGYVTFLITWSIEEGLISFTIDESNSKELWFIFALITNALTRVCRSAFPKKESLQVTQIFKEYTTSNETIDLRELFMEKWSIAPSKPEVNQKSSLKSSYSEKDEVKLTEKHAVNSTKTSRDKTPSLDANKVVETKKNILEQEQDLIASESLGFKIDVERSIRRILRHQKAELKKSLVQWPSRLSISSRTESLGSFRSQRVMTNRFEDLRFEAKIQRIGKSSLKATSAIDCIGKLETMKSEEICSVKITINLHVGTPIYTVTSDWEELMDNPFIREISGLIEIRVFHGKRYSEELAVTLTRMIRVSIGYKLKFGKLELEYDNDAEMLESQADELLDNLQAEDKEFLPPISFQIHSQAGLNFFDGCRKLNWPISQVAFVRYDFDHPMSVWERLKGTEFRIKFTNCKERERGFNLRSIMQVIPNIGGEIEFDSIEDIEGVLLHLLYDALGKKRESAEQVKSLKLYPNPTNSITLLGNSCEVGYVQNPTKVLDFLSVSDDIRIWSIETLHVQMKKYSEISSLSNLLDRISETNHSLMSFATNVDGPWNSTLYWLRKQMKHNITSKISLWIRSGVQVPYPRKKLVVLGGPGSGKTSIIDCLLGKPFQLSPSTKEAVNILDVSVDTDIWEEHPSKETFLNRELEEYISSLSRNLESGQQDPLLLYSSKMSQDSKNAKTKNQAKKIPKKLTIWDINDGALLESLHHMFLTNEGIYIVAFNLEQMVDNTDDELSLVEYWINSLSMHAPRASVIFVGTRAKRVKEEYLGGISADLMSLAKQKNILVQCCGVLSFFPVDCSARIRSLKHIDALKTRISDCFQENIPTICLTWMYFMNHLVTRFKGVISSNQLFQIANDIGLKKERDVIPMLDCYKKSAGVIPLVTEKNNGSWKFSYVVLSPEWLMKALGNFIYDERMVKRNKTFYKNGETRLLISQYEKSGVLSRSLLLQILRKANFSAVHTDLIVNMCREMLLLSNFECNPDWPTVEDDSFYMVPAMSRQVANKVEIMKQASPDDCVNFYIHCNKYIPIGVFERIICIMLSLNRSFGGATIEPMIKKNFACFVFREVEIYIENQKENDDFRIAVSKHEAEELNLLVNVVNLIEEGLERLRSDVLGKEINAELQIESSNEDKMRCSWKDLIASVENPELAKVKTTLSDGRNKLKKYSLFDPFDQVAGLILKRKEDALQLEKDKNKLKWEYDVFLAHTWGPNNETHNQVVKIDKLLKEMKFRTWLDEANLKYFVSNDIVDGLKKSSCILVFITELYLEKVENSDTNASKEFAQAVSKGTEYLVPVVLDPKCLDPKSWLGSTVGYNFSDALYFDFSSEEKIEANIGRLCERIEEMSKAERPRTLFD